MPEQIFSQQQTAVEPDSTKEYPRERMAKRLETYFEKTKQDTHLLNRLYINSERPCMIINGNTEHIAEIGGFLKLPKEPFYRKVEQEPLTVCIVPRERLIIQYKENFFFRGYKTENHQDCMFFIYCKGEFNTVFIFDSDTEGFIPPLILKVDGDESASIDILYKQLRALFEKTTEKQQTLLGKDTEETKNDEWD